MSAAENDAFRTTLKGGKLIMTAAVKALSYAERVLLLARVVQFSDFRTDDTEHASGSFDFYGTPYAFKIEMIDGERVMTVMRVGN